MRLFSRLVVGGSGGEQPPTLKMSIHARFQGWWWVVVEENNHQHQKRAYALVFEVGGGWWWRKTTTNIKNEHTCSFSRLVQGGGGGHWWVVVVSNGRPWCQRRGVVGKKPLPLAFKRGRGGGGVKQVVVVSIEGGGVNRGWWCQWRVVAIIISMRQEACRVEMPIKMNK